MYDVGKYAIKKGIIQQYLIDTFFRFRLKKIIVQKQPGTGYHINGNALFFIMDYRGPQFCERAKSHSPLLLGTAPPPEWWLTVG